MHRSDVDDAPPLRRLHGRQRQARGVERTAQVDGDDGVPALRGKVLEARHVLNASVVDQNIHWAELCCSELEHIFNIRRTRHISAVVLHRHGCAAAVRGGQHFSAWAFDVAKAVEHDVGALARQRFSDTQTNTAGRTGDEGSFAFKHEKSPNELRCTATIIKPCFGA